MMNDNSVCSDMACRLRYRCVCFQHKLLHLFLPVLCQYSHIQCVIGTPCTPMFHLLHKAVMVFILDIIGIDILQTFQHVGQTLPDC